MIEKFISPAAISYLAAFLILSSSGITTSIYSDWTFWAIAGGVQFVGGFLCPTDKVKEHARPFQTSFVASSLTVVSGVAIINYFNAARLDSVSSTQALAVAVASTIIFVSPFLSAALNPETDETETSGNTASETAPQAS